MSEIKDIGIRNPNNQNDDGTIFDETRQEFMLENLAGPGCVEIIAEKDKHGDYPVVDFFYERDGKKTKFKLSRDELAAITFALARQDQQSRLLNSRFREYKEVLVRLVVEAKKDIRKGENVVVWRREKVPVDFEYTHEKFNNTLSFK